jgi:hypothetical protein
MTTKKKPVRKPPVHLPLPFEKAVEGLLGVKPSVKKKAVAKKSGTKKAR